MHHLPLANTRVLICVVALACWPRSSYGQSSYTFNTLAGVSAIGSEDGIGSAARFNFPQGIAVDGRGTIYVADSGNHTIRRITPGGRVSTLAGLAGSAGSADGAGGAARFNFPAGIAVDDSGTLYVADRSNHTIRKITPTGIVSTLAGVAGSPGSLDGLGSAARFTQPNGVAVDSQGTVYVTDITFDRSVRTISAGGVVKTLAGGLSLYAGGGIAVDRSGTVYVTRSGTGFLGHFTYPVGGEILAISPAGIVTTLAGSIEMTGSVDGPGSAARFNSPIGLAVDASGAVFAADSGNDTLRRVAPPGTVTTLAGSAGKPDSIDGDATVARFSYPFGVTLDPAGTLYVTDSDNQTIRQGVFGTPTTPSLDTQPVNLVVAAGQHASFTVSATGNPVPGYQWQLSTNGGVTWTDLADTGPYSGTGTATLTISSVTTSPTGAQYRAIASNSVGAATSTAATLTVGGPLTVSAISAGYDHTCALTGSGAVACWGANASGQLGDGTTTAHLTPVPVSGLSSGVTAIAANGSFDPSSHTCAVITAGAVVCWGDNTKGQLGDGTTTNRLTPVPVRGLSSGVTTVAAGNYHTCAVTGEGGVACWGYNADGQLGDGTTTTRLTPVAVSGLSSGITAVAAGFDHTCALTIAGGVVCWGTNNSGQLGDGTTTNRLTPVAVSGLSSGVIAVAAGWHHTCAVTSAGGVVCWGSNFAGALGDGTTTNRLVPVPVSGLTSGASAIAAGEFQTYAVVSGAALQWGIRALAVTVLTPEAVSGLSSGVTAIAAGTVHACALAGRGAAVCWGGNFDGQLGDGTTTDRYPPVAVQLGVLVSPATLQFAVTKNGAALEAVTPAQTVRVAFADATSAWTASGDQPWLQLTHASAVGNGQFTVAIVNPGDAIGAATALSANITLTFSTTPLSLVVVPVTLTVEAPAISQAPLGTFDTPANGATVAGSIAVTGWALDDIGVDHVEIWRDLIAGETTPPYAGAGPGYGKVFIANAWFIAGARPDVAAAYPSYPQAELAGWGYLLLTQGLWNQGNGTVTLYAFAYDQDGHRSTLGSKTITADNAHAVKPFGALDTPTYGQTVTSSFWNYGWALTPNPNSVDPRACVIPNGNVQVAIDSGPLLSVSYGDLRADIATAFPGFSNSDGAGGAYFIDTTTLSNDTHQIGWFMTDSCGRVDGIGSRFFTVLNGSSTLAPVLGSRTPASTTPVISASVATPAGATSAAPAAGSGVDVTWQPVEVRRGDDVTWVYPNPSGTRVVSIGQGQRAEVRLPPVNGGTYAGFQTVNGERRRLPVGSSLDPDRSIFYWQPATGFLGAHDLEFVPSGSAGVVRMRAVIGTAVQAVIDTPSSGVASPPFVIAGWAIDQAAAAGAGIDTVHVWAYPVAGGAPIFLGVAAHGGERPDIAARFGDQFLKTSYSLVVNTLATGAYDIVVYPHSAVTGDFHGAQTVRIEVR